MFRKGNQLGKLNRGRVRSKETRLKISQGKKGRSMSPETQFTAENMGGERHWNWKGGQSVEERSWQKNKRNRSKRANGGTHTYGEWEALKAQYNWTCPCCKESEPDIKLTQDHIIPVSRGGSDNIENIQPLCMKCNLKKHTQIVKYIRD